MARGIPLWALFCPMLAGCGLFGDGAANKATEIVRNALGDPNAAVWDVKVCRDDNTGRPLNAVGFVTGGSSGRVWLLEWGEAGPKGDVDIEHGTAKDASLHAFYQYLRGVQKGANNCRYISHNALQQSLFHYNIANGMPVSDAMKLLNAERRVDSSEFTSHYTN
jgi:hypothetical protein